MELKELFEAAIINSKTLPEKPSNDILLQLYALYKQSTEGDINVDAPANPFDFVAKAKYASWEELKGKPKETAMQEYVDLVAKLRS
jgi:diazepam-binding inhibitor (GABA receptor modulating acyl-CoA-binding protein)